MAIFRNVHISFWTDPKVVDDFTPEDKYFFVYLLTNPHTNLCGCYEISIKQMSDELGYNKETVEKLLDRFHAVHQRLAYCKQTKELLLYNWPKYNWTKSPKFQAALIQAIPKVKNPEFRTYLEGLLNGDTVSIPFEYSIDTAVAGLGDSGQPPAPPPAPEPPRETVHTIFKRILPDYDLSDRLQKTINDWLTYKIERKESYKEMGLKSLLRQIETNASRYGDDAVCQLIEYCMACNWAGIIFERLKQKTQRNDSYASSNSNNGHTKEVQSQWGTVGIDL